MEREQTLNERMERMKDSLAKLEATDARMDAMEKLVLEMENLFIDKKEEIVLTEGEKELYRIKLNVLLPSRFNNYKQKSPLPIHYRILINDIIEKMLDKGKFECSGISSSTDPVSQKCPNQFRFTPNNLVLLEFDHWYERSDIYQEIEKAIEEIIGCREYLENFPNAQNAPVSYLKTNFSDPPKNKLRREIHEFISLRINLNLIRDDLYGSNIYMRCTLCHSACKSSNFHPTLQRGRYRI